MKYTEFFLKNTQNFRFFVREWIPEKHPKGLILLLHGLSDHSGRFVFVGESFAREGYIFVAPDLRGNGQSEGKRGHFDSLEQVMSDIHFLLQENKKRHPGLPLILYSQSMGGNLAINFALRFPDVITCAIASSPWLRLSKQPSPLLLKLASFLAKAHPRLLIPNGLKSRDLCHDQVIRDAYDNDPLIHWKISASTFLIIHTIGEWAVLNAPMLKIPLLLLHSKADPITSFRASEQFAQNANTFLTFLTFKEQYHELHNESIKEEVIGKMTSWLISRFPKE
jgi:alpha-beta hydrolase superfamily lysophospholipase